MTEEDVADDADGYHDDAWKGGVVVGISFCQWDATQIGSNSIAEIEGKLYHAACQEVTSLAEAKQKQLLG